MKYTAAVITISDKGSRGERVDTSGPAVRAMLEGADFDVVYTSIIPDEMDQIQTELIKCADELKIGLVMTTGGTGFSRRDNAPEATLDAIERQAPGIAEAMRINGLQYTQRSMLSRGVSGIRKYTLIINLPGSPRAVRENLGYVLPALDHGIAMLVGDAAECARPEQG